MERVSFGQIVDPERDVLFGHVIYDRVDDMARNIRPEHLACDADMTCFLLGVAANAGSYKCFRWLLQHCTSSWSLRGWLYRKMYYNQPSTELVFNIVEYGQGISVDEMPSYHGACIYPCVKRAFEARALRRDRQRALLAGLRSAGASKDLIRMFEAAIKNIC